MDLLNLRYSQERLVTVLQFLETFLKTALWMEKADIRVIWFLTDTGPPQM